MNAHPDGLADSKLLLPPVIHLHVEQAGIHAARGTGRIAEEFATVQVAVTDE